MKLVLQSEQSECGIACLAMIANYYGDHSDLIDFRRKFAVSLKGATLSHLMRHAAAMNLAARPLRLDIDEIQKLQLPCILHWNLNHFVVLQSVEKKINGKLKITILDPAAGKKNISTDELSKYFTGVALELTPTPFFEKRKEVKKISIGQLTGKIYGLPQALFQIFILALALEIFAIASPLFNQYVVDEVIVSGDRELLKVLVIGFTLLLITQTAIGTARSWFLMRWSIDIGMKWSTRIFMHLIKLPIAYFEKRHLGDIVSRFSSINSIQNTLSNLFVESVLDGLMALLALVMMFNYSTRLTFVVLIGVFLYMLLRVGFYSPLREASKERLILSAKENSNFLETIRAITALKLFGRESDRIARWQNLKQDVINRDVKTQKISIIFKVTSSTMSGAMGLAMFYMGADLVMQGGMTVGMLMAFSSYSNTFSARIFNLIDLAINLKMLGMHTERISDIVLESIEEDVFNVAEDSMDGIQPAILLKDVKFRYAEGEPWILDGINLEIPAGQSVALIGPSGCGKTTLCKIILGLLQPTEGDVYVGGVKIKQLGYTAYRRMIGTVMQDDVLLAGSIFDNISFFDPQPDRKLVEKCASLAAVHSEIVSMPMGYQTLVGDMGSSLSGGQKQRILLARALYKNPKILALDEATSHLDVQNEQKVNHSLIEMNLTRIMVAHRPETIKAADRIVFLSRGQAEEIRLSELQAIAA